MSSSIQLSQDFKVSNSVKINLFEMKVYIFGHIVVQFRSFEIQRKSRIDVWSQQHFKQIVRTENIHDTMLGDHSRSHNRGQRPKSWDPRGPMIWDSFSIFRTNCAILTSYIRANPRTCVGSRVDVVTLRDQMLRVPRFSCGFFTAMAGNKERDLLKTRDKSSTCM